MGKYLQDCAELERTLARAYRVLSERFRKENPEISQHLDRMATDEEAHASKITLAHRLNTLEGDIFKTEKYDAATSLEELKRVSLELLNDCRREGLTLGEAFAIVQRMESEFQKIHLEQAAEVRDQQLSKMFAALARGDEAHFQSLQMIQRNIRN